MLLFTSHAFVTQDQVYFMGNLVQLSTSQQKSKLHTSSEMKRSTTNSVLHRRDTIWKYETMTNKDRNVDGDDRQKLQIHGIIRCRGGFINDRTCLPNASLTPVYTRAERSSTDAGSGSCCSPSLAASPTPPPSGAWRLESC